jgi:arylsulfatase A-like enzyme
MCNTYFCKITPVLIFLCFANWALLSQTNPSNPNILLIIADDMGVDALSGYQNNPLQPVTPHLDSLRQAGVAFRNAWSNPQCTPTRASIMTGKYGHKTGVLNVPGNVDPSLHTSLFNALASNQNNAYSGALIGKYHIASPQSAAHASTLGIDHFEGVLSGSVNPDYNQWTKTIGGLDNASSTSTINEYATTHFTDNAIDWIDQQNQP